LHFAIPAQPRQGNPLRVENIHSSSGFTDIGNYWRFEENEKANAEKIGLKLTRQHPKYKVPFKQSLNERYKERKKMKEMDSKLCSKSILGAQPVQATAN